MHDIADLLSFEFGLIPFLKKKKKKNKTSPKDGKSGVMGKDE